MPQACPPLIGDGVFDRVDNQISQFRYYADGAYETARLAMEDLGQFSLDLIPVHGALVPNEDWWRYERPAQPEEPGDMTFDPGLDWITAPPTSNLPGVSFSGPPTFDEAPPVLPVRTEPGPLTATDPGDAPPIDDIDVPEAPDITIPEFPDIDVVLPEVPTITLPTFGGVRPDFDGAPPPNTFAFTVEDYQSALLDKTRSRISAMLDGGTGLPSAVAQALRDRAYSSIDIQETRAVQQAVEEYGARGFSQPSGILNRRLAEVRQNNQNERNKLSRDIYIRDEEIAVENLRFAVSNGVALESQLIQAHIALAQLGLEAAKATIQVAIDIFNAEIGLFNAQRALFETDAQVHRDLIQAELAKVEMYKAQLEGAGLAVDIAEKPVRYGLDRALAMVNIYNAQVGAAKARADVQVAILDAFRAKVQAYAERVKAYETEWDAFATQLEGDLTRQKNYEIATNVFGTRVRVWDEIQKNKIEQQRLAISEKELDLNAWRARTEKVVQLIGAEAQRLDAVVRVYAGRIAKYQADAGIEAVASEAHDKTFRLALDQETQRVALALKNAEIRINQVIQNAGLTVQAQQTVASVGGSLTAAAMSAMSAHTGVSAFYGNSRSCNTTFDDGG